MQWCLAGKGSLRAMSGRLGLGLKLLSGLGLEGLGSCLVLGWSWLMLSWLRLRLGLKGYCLRWPCGACRYF